MKRIFCSLARSAPMTMQSIFLRFFRKEWTEVREMVEKNLDTVQNMAFMEGYKYAIAVLEEGIVHMK